MTLGHDFLKAWDHAPFISLSPVTKHTDAKEAFNQACWGFYHIIKDQLVPMQFIFLQDRKRRNLPNTLYDVCTTLVPKSDKHFTKKENYNAMKLMLSDVKNFY